ncbi:MAG TPA: monovalent cation:proton antiporter-2 (CPA2) family protein [Bacteroidia bacterium]|nr:monovalent cation:proton antiporter-2 (CPA2) family protein [Bacteroidia bacterium]
MEGSFLETALVFLVAAVVCVPLAKKLGMGSVLGYLLAGILIGPFVLGFVGSEGHDIMHVAEFGVVMMLFLIGLELDPKEFWKMRRVVFGMGFIQMGVTTVILGGICYFALGFSHPMSLAASLALSMSSTAIVLQTLKEKGLMHSTGGQSSFAVLLFQDISVIPILAILPLLAGPQAHASLDSHSLLDGFAGWAQTAIVIGAVGGILLFGKYIVVPFLRLISKIRLREMFTASALLLVIVVAYVMQLVGLSPALGTFMAGVVLANSEFKHELESDLDPFKGLLLGLFFIAVGATINFSLIARQPMIISGVVLSVVGIKMITLYVAGKIFGLKSDQNILFSILLSQVGEFAFVLLTFSRQLDVINAYYTDLLMACTAISMTLTPLFVLVNEKLIDPYFGVKTKSDSKQREADPINEQHRVILAGFGHFGSTIGRFLRANGIESTILDHDSDRVDLLRKMGFKVYYGDATRLDLLRAAGAENAKMLIAAIDSPQINAELISTVRKHFPHLEIMARARNRFDAYELIDMGVHNIYRETLYTSVHMAIDVLRKMGFRGYTAMRKGLDFIRYDEAALEKLAVYRHDMEEYVVNVREQIEMQEKLLTEDLHSNLTAEDHAWDSEPMRAGTATNHQ